MASLYSLLGNVVYLENFIIMKVKHKGSKAWNMHATKVLYVRLDKRNILKLATLIISWIDHSSGKTRSRGKALEITTKALVSSISLGNDS